MVCSGNSQGASVAGPGEWGRKEEGWVGANRVGTVGHVTVQPLCSKGSRELQGECEQEQDTS